MIFDADRRVVQGCVAELHRQLDQSAGGARKPPAQPPSFEQAITAANTSSPGDLRPSGAGGPEAPVVELSAVSEEGERKWREGAAPYELQALEAVGPRGDNSVEQLQVL